MTGLLELHVFAGGLLVALAIVVGLWGLVRSRRVSAAAPIDPGTDPGIDTGGELHPVSGPPTRGDLVFRQLLALSQTMVFAAGLLGLAVLVLDENSPEDPLHARVYGPFMVVALMAAYGFRTADPHWNTRVFAMASLVIAALGVRAFATG